jgi:hypothetical protein
MMGESSAFTTRKEIQVLGNLDRFSKYLRNFEIFKRICVMKLKKQE